MALALLCTSCASDAEFSAPTLPAFDSDDIQGEAGLPATEGLPDRASVAVAHTPGSADSRLCVAFGDTMQRRHEFRDTLLELGEGPHEFTPEVRALYFGLRAAAESAEEIATKETTTFDALRGDFAGRLVYGDEMLRHSQFGDPVVLRDHSNVGEPGGRSVFDVWAWANCAELADELFRPPVSLNDMPGPFFRYRDDFCGRLEIIHTLRVAFRHAVNEVDYNDPASVADALTYMDRLIEYRLTIESDFMTERNLSIGYGGIFENETGANQTIALAGTSLEVELREALKGNLWRRDFDERLDDTINERREYFRLLARRCTDFLPELFEASDDDAGWVLEVAERTREAEQPADD